MTPPVTAGERPSATGAALVCWRPTGEPDGGRRADAGAGHGLEFLAGRAGPADSDGWLLPRATARAQETLPQTAVRALTPSTARLEPRLGAVLHQGGGTTFWAARLRGPDDALPRAVAASGEQLAWLPAERSDDLLARAEDRAAVAAAVEQAARRQLATRPLIVLRHAAARSREQWDRADAYRPLEELGRRQSLALAALLECWHPERLLSSPWRRCVETLLPYAGAQRLRIRNRDSLSEHVHASAPGRAAGHLRTVLARHQPTLVCTHRPVLPTLLEQLRLQAAAAVRDVLPTEDPYLAPSEILVAHLAPRARPGAPRVLAVELHDPAL